MKNLALYTEILSALVIGWCSLLLWIPRELFPEVYSTLLYSAEGKLLGARIAEDGQWRFPPLDSVPGKFATCLIAYEDKRFRWHPGVDFIALGRAVKSNLANRGIVSGGSTLTMQLARIARGNQPRNLWEKSKETLWAFGLEARYSKAEILVLYASHAPFGGNVVGLETAAWRYYGRSADLLSWAEAATLAVLPNSPALIHPGRNREALKRKRDKLLATLYNMDIIDG